MAENERPTVTYRDGPWWRQMAETLLRQGIGWTLLTIMIVWLIRVVDVKLDGLIALLDGHNTMQLEMLNEIKDNGKEDQRDRRVLIELEGIQCRFNTEGSAKALCDEIVKAAEASRSGGGG